MKIISFDQKDIYKNEEEPFSHRLQKQAWRDVHSGPENRRQLLMELNDMPVQLNREWSFIARTVRQLYPYLTGAEKKVLLADIRKVRRELRTDSGLPFIMIRQESAQAQRILDYIADLMNLLLKISGKSGENSDLWNLSFNLLNAVNYFRLRFLSYLFYLEAMLDYGKIKSSADQTVLD